MGRVLIGALAGLALGAGAPGARVAAQDGPSFACADSDTATERAICASPELSRLEMTMFRAYEGLVGRIGEVRARRLADGLLAERQACGGDAACIETRLMVSLGVFLTEGAAPLPGDAGAIAAALPPPAAPVGAPALAAAEPERGPVAEFEPEPGPERAAEPGPERLAEREFGFGRDAEDEAEFQAGFRAGDAPADSGPDSGPDVGLDLEPDLEPDVGPEPEVAAPARDRGPAPEGAPDAGFGPEPGRAADRGADPGADRGADPAPDLAAEPPFAPEPDSALGLAFLDLPDYRRRNVQGRLADAGYEVGAADGRWTLDTEAALLAFLEDAGGDGRGFDADTPAGAEAALSYIDSDAFKRTYMGEAVPLALEW